MRTSNIEYLFWQSSQPKVFTICRLSPPELSDVDIKDPSPPLRIIAISAKSEA